MVDVVPFNGITFNSSKVLIDRVICPPYDIISIPKREELYERDKNNYVRIVFGEGGHERSAKLFNEWLEEGILNEEKKPCFYVYQQEFEFNGKKLKRNCLVVALKLEEFGKGKVFPHEQTFSGPKEDRLVNMRNLNANAEAILGLYSNAGQAKEIMDSKSTGVPFIEAKDDFNVMNRLWKIENESDISKIVESMKNSSVFIADGHHRYETAINYSKENKSESAKYILIMLAPLDGEEIAILPTHRMVRGLNFEATGRIRDGLAEYFNISDLPDLKTLLKSMSGKKHAFGFMCRHKKFHLLELKPEIDLNNELSGNNSPDWKQLDVNILHKIIIEKVLKLAGEEHSPEGKIGYTRDAIEAEKLVNGNAYEVAFFLNGCSPEEVKAISLNGEKMPHKSTYFWPKQISGIIARKIS